MVQIASTGLQTYVYTSYLVKKHEVDWEFVNKHAVYWHWL
jgi:hypothetical protein